MCRESANMRRKSVGTVDAPSNIIDMIYETLHANNIDLDLNSVGAHSYNRYNKLPQHSYAVNLQKRCYCKSVWPSPRRLEIEN